jgi:hypothetical protein
MIYLQQWNGFPSLSIAMNPAASKNLMVLLESFLAGATTDSPTGCKES